MSFIFYADEIVFKDTLSPNIIRTKSIFVIVGININILLCLNSSFILNSEYSICLPIRKINVIIPDIINIGISIEISNPKITNLSMVSLSFHKIRTEEVTYNC